MNALREADTRSTMPYSSLPADGRRSDGLMAYSGHQSCSRVWNCTTRPCRLLETVIQGDYRRTCTTSDARLAMLPALWESPFGDSAEAAGDRRKAYKPFSGPESLGQTGSADPELCRGREKCGPSGKVSPAESLATASIHTDGLSRSSMREWLT